MIVIVPLLVLLIGILLHVFAKNPTLGELARAMIWIGLLFTVSRLAGQTLGLL